MSTHHEQNETVQNGRRGSKGRSGGSHGSHGSRAPRGLIVLNLALLGGLGLVSFAPSADAQSGVSVSRVPGEYSVVAGASVGGVSSVIYVIDSANREMIALSWNDSIKSLEGIGYRDLSLDSTGDPDR